MTFIPRRVACIALTEIRVEIVRQNEEGQSAEPGIPNRDVQAGGYTSPATRSPLAVVVARAGGAIKGERDILGGTKLDVVSEEARALGVRVGQTVAEARAKCAQLRVRVVAQEAVRTALERVAEAALAFGPTVSVSVAEDIVWVEIGGCAHLCKGGERELGKALGERIRVLGHVCRIAIADGPLIAAAIARFAPADKKGPFVLQEGKGAAAMRCLPIFALGLSPDTTAWLDRLGLNTCGDLQKLPRRSLGTRLGARAHDVIRLLDGDDPTPLAAWRPAEVPEERIELEWGASSTEALAFVIKPLCEKLATRLEGRAMAASRIELVLTLDRALCEGSTAVVSIDITLPSPVFRAADLFTVVRTRLEREALAAPALAVTLRALLLKAVSPRAIDMLAPEPKAAQALPRLILDLVTDFGPANVGTLALSDTWAAEGRTRLVPFGAPAASNRHAFVTAALEPSRLVPPTPVPRASMVEPALLARIEGTEWWRREGARSDFVAAWIAVSPATTEKLGALAWVEVHGQAKNTFLRGWID